jgi:hypothetical protein
MLHPQLWLSSCFQQNHSPTDLAFDFGTTLSFSSARSSPSSYVDASTALRKFISNLNLNISLQRLRLAPSSAEHWSSAYSKSSQHLTLTQPLPSAQQSLLGF